MIKKRILSAVAAAFTAAALFSCGTTIGRSEEETSNVTVKSGESSAPSDDGTNALSEPASEAQTEPPTEPFSMDVSVPENAEKPKAYKLEGFKAILQTPELPTGCEATSLTQTLNYLGFDVDKITIADEFMPIDLQGAVVMNEAYVGDPYLDGFGCNSNVIVQTADKYFASVDSPCYAVDLAGISFDDLLWQVSQGRPVITWVTIDMKITNPEVVWTAGNGEDFVFNWYQHCLTIYGYDLDKGEVYTADPLEGDKAYPIEQIKRAFEVMGNQAVVICGDSDTKGPHVTTEAEKSITMPTRKEIEEEKEKASAEEPVQEDENGEAVPVEENEADD